MDQDRDARTNHLLCALSGAEWRRWQPQLEGVDLKRGQVLYEAGRPQRHVYFPTGAIVSLLYITESGASAEIAVVGNEGAVGASLFLGGGFTTGHAVVLGAGPAFRIGSQVIREEFARPGPALHLLLRYTQALMTQIAQTAVCNRHHTIDQQVCRLLLLSLDRLPGSELLMTQELIARQLGVRREGVTEVAHHLQAAGLIRHSRGHISVLDRQGLEHRTCECYAVVKKEYDRLLPEVAAAQPGDTGPRAMPARAPEHPGRATQRHAPQHA